MRKHFTILLAALAAITLGVVAGTASEAVDTDTPTVEAYGGSTGYMGLGNYWGTDDAIFICAGTIDHWGYYNNHSHRCRQHGVAHIRYPGQSAHCYRRHFYDAYVFPYQNGSYTTYVRTWISPLFYQC